MKYWDSKLLTVLRSMHLASFSLATLICFLSSHSFATMSCEGIFQIASEASVSAVATDQNAVEDSLALLYKMQDFSEPDQDPQILAQRHTLFDYLQADPSKNLAVQSPLDVMNAAQRMLALIYSQGHSKVRLPLSGEEVDYYPFFSSGLPITDGYRIIGNETVIQELVNNLKAQASGDRSGVSVLLLVGGAATGKSETLKLLSLGAKNLTSKLDPQFALHTYAWTNLAEIPALHRFIPAYSELNGTKKIPDLDSPLGDSPFTILPPEIQKLVLKNSEKAGEKLLQGMAPSPFATPDPVSQFIRNEIIAHYTQLRGHPLSAGEIVEVLNKHIVVKRQLLSQSYNKMPLIDAQGNDLDIAGLFMSPNPVVRFAAGTGPTHPMAWFLNGKILTGHGNAIQFEEFFRNPKELRSMLLSAFESRVINISGAPSTPFDSFMIAATNTANLMEVLNEGNSGSGAERLQGTGYASVSRFNPQAMRYTVFPHLSAMMLLNGQLNGAKKSLYQQSLEQADAPISYGNLDELFPKMEGNSKVITPDYRYRLWIGSGPNRVEVAPHTIMMMAEILSATRMITDPNEAQKVFNGKIVTSNLYRNPIDRLRLNEGLMPDVQADVIRELNLVSTLLKQGETGIDPRAAARWLSRAVEMARSDATGWTLTPGVALKAFRLSIAEGKIPVASNKVRIEWQDLATEVANQLLIPRLEADISKALSNGDRVVNDAYFDIIDEMYALHTNEKATTYTSSATGQERMIDRKRLEAVYELYKKKFGRELNISQIAIFHSRQQAVGAASRIPEENLLSTVAAYYASLNTQLAGFNALVEYEKTGNGTDEVQTAHASLVAALKRMGYNDVSIRDAMMLIYEHKNRTEKQP